MAQCSVMVNAGQDTTTAALTMTLVTLFQSPKKLAKVRQEINPYSQDGRVRDYATVSNLPYLRASIEALLRINPPPIAMGLPRVVPPGGWKYENHHFRPGTIVIVTIYTM